MRTTLIRLAVAAGSALALLPSGGPAHAAPTPHAAPPVSAADLDACRLVSQGRIAGVHGRPKHVLVALADRYGTSNAQVTSCVRQGRRYVTDWSVAGHVGRAGFAPRGEKREGDGRSPTGVFRLGVAFGAADPGGRGRYLRLRPDSCWGSTVGSPRYNRYFRGECGPADERMFTDVRGAYRQGMLIRYNRSPIRQGAGSAIFLHVTTGGPTAGCVSIPLTHMTRTIRQARHGDVIAMGTVADLVRPPT